MNKPAAKDDKPAEPATLPDPAEVAKTYAEVAERASKLLGEHVQRQLKRGVTPPADELGIAQAFMDMTSRLLSNPYKLAQAQMGLVWDYYDAVAAVDAEVHGRRCGAGGHPGQGRQPLPRRGVGKPLPVRLLQAELPDRRPYSEYYLAEGFNEVLTKPVIKEEIFDILNETYEANKFSEDNLLKKN